MVDKRPEFKIIERIHPPGGEEVSLTQKLDQLKASVDSLRLTPVIGAEASVIGRRFTTSWWRMSSEMKRTLSHLRAKEGKPYFSSLMRLKGVSTGGADEGESQAMQPELADLRTELVCLADEATEVFSVGMAHVAVTELADCSVVVSRDDHIALLYEALVSSCLAALKATKTLRRDSDPRYMYRRLLDLTYKFMGGRIPDLNREPFPALRDADTSGALLAELHSDLLDRTAVTKDCQHRLYLHQLQWLADLIFHSFSWEATFYPTNDELAFRAALRIDTSRQASDMRPPYVSVFERGIRGSLTKDVSTWFSRYGKDPDGMPQQMTDFYRAIALLLQIQHSHWKGTDPMKRFEPVVFSLSLDQEVERALRNCQSLTHYCVALPVEATLQDSPEKQVHQRWLLAAFDRDGGHWKETWAWYNPAMTMDEDIKGPVVVKLHGSPLQKLPKPIALEDCASRRCPPGHVAMSRGDCVYSDPLEHCTSVSASGCMQDIIVLKNLPDFFQRILKSSRDFCFLGVSTSEWDAHLRIADFVFPPPQRRLNPDRVMIAIDERFDEYQSSILDSLGIERWQGTLQQFTTHLLEYLDEYLDRIADT